ncbi:hypothetical protein KAR91_85365 [Candidatus Pacearchaeota archaeon]|nr:hypothetical protein [Candidatus Pacearchaeota archaeon]
MAKTGEYSLQAQRAWDVVRDNISAAESALDAETTKWASIISVHKDNLFRCNEQDDRVKIRFRFSSKTANCNYSVYAINRDDDAFDISDGIAYAGEQEATVEIDSNTTYHGDKITIANDYWALPPRSSSEDDTANNKRAMLILSNLGVPIFLVVITAISAGAVSVDMSSYKG